MTRAVAIAAFLVLGCVTAATARGADVQIAGAPSDAVLAYDGWISWYELGLSAVGRPPVRRLLHGGRLGELPVDAGDPSLGTDAAGRAVAIFVRCRHPSYPESGCRLVQRDLRSGRERSLPSPRGLSGLSPVAEWHRAVAYTRRIADEQRLYLRTAGRRHAVGISSGFRYVVSLRGRWLLDAHENTANGPFDFRAVDLERNRRSRLLASDDTYDEDCRCESSFSSFGAPALDDHFAYWLKRDMSPREYGGNGEFHEYVYRVDLAHPKRRPRYVEIPRAAYSLAVDRGTLYYAGDSIGVWRLDHPAWRDTPDMLPLRA